MRLKPTKLTAMLSVAEASKIFSVSEKTVRRWIDAGELRAHRLGRAVRISEEAIRSFLLSRSS
jgi:excisionase family DNA binding protein